MKIISTITAMATYFDIEIDVPVFVDNIRKNNTLSIREMMFYRKIVEKYPTFDFG